MNNIVPRTCTEIRQVTLDQSLDAKCTSLKEVRSAPAYVLLGDPGSGKSTEFDQECRKLGQEAVLITARDFLALASGNSSAWQGKTLFIDGLDEVRAGTDNVRTPFEQIRSKLQELGRPKFRISCREADWLGENDRTNLSRVSQDSRLRTLRLNPLTVLDVGRILKGHPGISDAGKFIEEAGTRGLEGMLYNPQTLGLLADSVAQEGGWPESRLEIFENACRRMAQEQNQEHKVFGHPPKPDDALDAAGWLSAVQLISGRSGWSKNVDDARTDYIDLEKCEHHLSELPGLVLSTMLFKSEGEGYFTSIHRHIAEFLGGRYLGKMISGGLPAMRVLALMTGEDGIVVSELRGLSAWLAAHYPDVRGYLIERDPVGIGLYGDISGFSTDEKRRLVKALHREAARLGYSSLAAMAFRSLVTPETVPTLCDELTDTNRDHDQQMLVGFLLQVLRYGSPLTQLSQTLIDIVRDETRWPWVKQLAVSAFAQDCHDEKGRTEGLRGLLTEIHGRRISDPDNEILGLLLTELYPLEVTPSAVWDYLAVKANPTTIGAYQIFWGRKLLAQSSNEDAIQLLDGLKARLPDLWPVLADHYMDHIPVELLSHVLETSGDLAIPAQIYVWLEAVISKDKHGFHGLHRESWNKVRLWLERRPEVQKAIMLEGSKRWDGFHPSMYKQRLSQLMCNADLPSDFGNWCLDQALETSDLQTAECLLAWAVNAVTYQVGAEGLSLEVILERTQENPGLKDALQPLLVCNLSPEHFEPMKSHQEWKRYIDRDRQERRTLLEDVRCRAEDLRENRADHWTLYEIAEAHYSNQKNLRDLLGYDDKLVEAAYTGLRGTIWREDLPDHSEIIQAGTESRGYYIALPFLAGMDETDREEPEQLWQLAEPHIQRALAFYYFTPTEGSEEPEWYKRWVNQAPRIVADMITRCAMPAIRGGKEHIPFRYGLAYELKHSEVSRLVTLPLLRGFPVRCKSQQLSTLDDLLWAALKHADKASFQELIDKKLSRKSMNVAQRIHWLAAGLMLAPSEYQQGLEDFVSGHDDRCRQLASFCSPKGQTSIGPDSNFSPLVDDLGMPVIELLIRLTGRSFGPVGMLRGWVTDEYLAQNRVRELIQRLASSPNEDATRALQALGADERLHKWKDELDEARNRQQVIRRDATYRHSSVEQICRTLNGGVPANAGDLSALVLDCLNEIGMQIRTGNTNDWRQYWNEDSSRDPQKPKHGNSCRDALLSDLRRRLPQGVDAQPEPQYANDKRPDIRVSFADFHIPVEAKKNTHRDLWSAPREQLISKYSSDPATGGFGIYLVFWFGETLTQMPGRGSRPSTPEALRKQLEATLTEDEARKCSIYVIDVARTH